MGKFIRIFLLIYLGIFSADFLSAVEINCSSPVHKNKPKCKGKSTVSSEKKAEEFDSWFPIGYTENRIAAAWVQLKSFEKLNEFSFRLKAKDTLDNGAQRIGKLDLNCKNKDYYFRPNGLFSYGPTWLAIPEGSGVASVANIFCRNTSARSDWGYADKTRYIWDQKKPEGDPSNLGGEWILHYDRDDGEGYYNTEVKKLGDTVIYGAYFRMKKGDRSAAQPGDTSKYLWAHKSCKENLSSEFFKPDESIEGFWLAPIPGRPGGTDMAVGKRFCD